MSLSNEWWEYHLTPKGWVSGSEKLDFGSRTDVPRPEDRVLTLRRIEKQTSIYSSMQIVVETDWETDDRPLLEELIEKFGARPKRLQDIP